MATRAARLIAVWPLGIALAMLGACAEGRSAGSAAQISDSGFGAYEVSLAVLPRGLAVAWYDTRDGNAEIYVRLLDDEGEPAGPPERLTHDPEQSYDASVDAAGHALAVAWYDKDAAGSLDAWLGLWEPGTGFRWRIGLAPDRPSRNPVVRVRDDRIFCAWIERADDGSEAVRGGWWDLDGRPRRAPERLGPAGRTTWNLNAALDDEGRAYVVFDAAHGTRAEELYLARLDAAGVELVRLTDDDGHRSKYPDLAIEGRRAALTWFDERDGNREVYLFAGSTAELDGEVEGRSRRVTVTPGDSIGAYVAWNGPRIGLAWSDPVEDTYEIFFRSFDSSGVAAAPARRVTRTPAQSLIPAIRPFGTGFAIGWNEYVPDPSGAHGPGDRSEVTVEIVE